jgi:hypothetical protein
VVKPIVSQNQVARRIETGNKEVLKVDIAGREPDEWPKLPVDDRRGAVEIPELNQRDRIQNKTI